MLNLNSDTLIWSKHGIFVMFTNNLNGLAWVHPKALMPVLTNINIYFGAKKKGELELHKKSKLDGPYNS
jgi:hypothetical protein